MMDKNKVLPLAFDWKPPKAILGQQVQQDADWERIKPLVEALQSIAKDNDDLYGCHHQARAREALAQLVSMEEP